MDCKALSREIVRIAGLADGELSPAIRRHLAECGACARALAAERLCRGILRACGEAPVPPPGFAARVAARLPRLAEAAQAWRPAWGLIPAFAAAAAALVIVYGTSAESVPAGLLPVHELTAGERLVFQERGTSPDAILSAILEGEP
jgi:hypothetical protein